MSADTRLSEERLAKIGFRNRGGSPDLFVLVAEVRRLREALERIAQMPTTEFNPDGNEQAACSMQLAARDSLEADPDAR